MCDEPAACLRGDDHGMPAAWTVVGRVEGSEGQRRRRGHLCHAGVADPMTDSRADRGVERPPRQLMSAALVCIVMTLSLAGAQYDAPGGFHRRAVQLSANIGSSKLLECDTSEMAGDVFRSAAGGVGGSLDAASDGGGAGSDHIMTWRKQGHEVPIFIQFNGYPPHVDESYQGRIRLVEMTAIEISDLRAQDEGWYECSVVRLEGTDESSVNGSWIYLTINYDVIMERMGHKQR